MLEVHTDVVDYINLIELKEGLTLAQFKPIEPFDVHHVEVAGAKEILVSADYSGILMWNTTDKYVYSWKIKIPPPLYLTAGSSGNAISIAKDGTTAISIDTRLGIVRREAQLPAKALGKPVFYGSSYYVPVEGSLLVIGDDLRVRERYSLSSLKGGFSVSPFKDYVYLIGTDAVIRLGNK